MRDSEAARLVGMLFSYFPSAKELTPETTLLWTQEVKQFEVIDVSTAATTLGTMSKYPPTLAYFTESIIDERNHRLGKVKALPRSGSSDGPSMSFAEYLAYPFKHGSTCKPECSDEHHLRLAHSHFTAEIRAMYESAADTDLTAEEATMRLYDQDYHVNDRIRAAEVVVVTRMKDLGLPKPVVVKTPWH